MSPQEWFWELDSKYEEHKRLKEITADPKDRGKPDAAAWARARREHTEKMKRNG